MVVGSAPRVRGTHQKRSRRAKRVRFSPACAGNTSMEAPGNEEAAVQPRVCGEHKFQTSHASTVVGSAPRVRGTLIGRFPKSAPHRFSPACAGNTSSEGDRRLRTAVQPRVCGEHLQGLFRNNGEVGSAPRVRGTPPYSVSNCRIGRFSPACAGNTTLAGALAPIISVQPRVCGEHSVKSPLCSICCGSAPRVRGTQ